MPPRFPWPSPRPMTLMAVSPIPAGLRIRHERCRSVVRVWYRTGYGPVTRKPATTSAHRHDAPELPFPDCPNGLADSTCLPVSSCLGAARTAQTVSPTSSARTPQVRQRCSTMLRPRPLTDDADGCPACGTVALPPSLTATSTEVPSTAQAT